MGSRYKPRITNCQRAAFCGLMIAGLRFSDACAVSDVSQSAIYHVLPVNWIKHPPFKHYRSWKGATLEAMRVAYVEQGKPAREIADMFGIQVTYLYRVAVREGWPRRAHPMRLAGKRLRDQLTCDQFRLYNKLRAHGVERPVAFAEATR